VLWDVDLGIGAQPSGVRTERFAARNPNARAALPPAKVGYVLPWNASTAAAVAEVLRAGVRVSVAGGAFTLAGRSFPIGAAIVRAAGNPAGLPGVLGPIVARHGAEAVPIDTAFVDEGVSLGSNQVRTLQSPRVLLAWDTPTSSLSAGWARYVLEQRYGIVPSAVRVSSLGRADLPDFQVLVLPSGNYGTQLGGDLLRRIKDWVSAGGTLITLAEATRWASQESVGLLATRMQMKDGRPEGADASAKPGTEPAKGPIDLDRAIQPPAERPDLVPGAILHVRLDTEQLLSAGTDGEVAAMVEGQRVLAPITLDKGRNVGVYAAADRLVASGFVWPESRDMLPNKAYLVEQPMGRGRIVAFSEDPNARALAEATQLLFVNAVLFGAAR
jgi:hypothetical protein